MTRWPMSSTNRAPLQEWVRQPAHLLPESAVLEARWPLGPQFAL